MTANLASRDEVRTNFAGLLRGQLVGSGPAQTVYDYLVKDFDGQSPVLVMASSGMWPRNVFVRGAKVEYRLNCLVFVLRGESGTNYDEGDADTLLDQCAKGLLDVVAAHQVTPWWKTIEFWQESFTMPTRIGAWDYWMETHNLSFWCF